MRGLNFWLLRGKEDGRGDRIRTCDPQTPSLMRYQAALRPDLGGRTYSPPPSLASRNGGRVRSAVAVRFAPPSRILRALDTPDREHFLARAVVFAKYAHHSAGVTGLASCRRRVCQSE